MDKDILILGVETSCDETSAAIVGNGRVIRSNIISSQVELHKKFGGVVPEIASRKHIETICAVVDQAFEAAQMTYNDVDAVAVTCGPGLVGALLVGLSYAKGFAFALDKPLIGVQHIEGHICSNYLENEDWSPPFICLVVSGGHTNIVHVRDYDDYEILGRTRDDAAGEAFDKIARALGLGYPGGPALDALAKSGDPHAIEFPRAISDGDSLDFSFSGLKSAVLNYLNKNAMTGTEVKKPDVAASFQEAVIDVLSAKTLLACRATDIKKVALAGGVTANSALRARMSELCKKHGFSLHIPDSVYCTDNAAMIACRGYYDFLQNRFSELSLNAYPTLAVGGLGGRIDSEGQPSHI